MAIRPKTGGRRRGTRNKATLQRERDFRAAAATALASPGAFLGDAWTLLVSIYKCSELPIEIRLEAAKAAIPFEKPRLAPIQPPEPAEAVEAKALRLHQLLAEMRATIGNGSTNGHAVTMDSGA